LTNGRLFLAIGIAALVAGSASWLALRPPARSSGPPELAAPEIAPAAILAMTFDEGPGRTRSLAEFSGEVVVVNFWATWCGPCRAEMPAFDRVAARWAGRGVRFVGLSSESPDVASGFGRSLGIRYPLWTGGDRVGELSRRLGNRLGVLPHTAILLPGGRVSAQRVGPYTEEELDTALAKIAPKSS
jgi:thiol-disulfide isomerase/thioredoxin